MTELDEAVMKASSELPKSQEEIEFDKKVREWKSKRADMAVAPFSAESWAG